MDTLSKKITTLAVCAWTLVPLCGSAFGAALSPVYPVPYQSITVQEESTIERTALVALRRISQARAELHRNDQARARQDLTEANRLIDTIRDSLSPAAARELIQVARRHLEYQEPGSVVRDLAPVYAALERASIYLPTDKATAHLDSAKKLLEGNDKAGADRELVEADRSLVVVEIEPSLASSQQYLKQAQDDLAAGDTGKADTGLQSAEKEMTTLYTGMNSLLYQAKQQLWLAVRYQAMATSGSLEQFLARARDYLARAAIGGNTTGRVEAGKLAKEVLAQEQALSAQKRVAPATLKALWEKCAALSERSAGYLAAGLTETATALWHDNDLIEARLHVSYAETYQFTTGESEKAAAELKIAHRYLDEASRSTLIAEGVRSQVRGIDDVVRSLGKNTKQKTEKVRERYGRAEGELGKLIRKL